jgi:hypothetical protein
MSVWWGFWIIVDICHNNFNSSSDGGYQKAEVKVKAFHPSSNQRCMCSWKKLETWLATADLDMGHEGQHPWREYLWQK